MKYIFTFIIVLSISIFSIAQTGYTSYFTGDTTDVATPTAGGVVVMGGSTESDDAMRWWLNRSGGGDIVVIRTSGSNGYNTYLYSDLGVNVNSVETIVFTSAAAANDPYVLRQLRHAEAIWIAGGDQAVYTNYWRNTPVETILNELINIKKVPFGGTSAGCAILGNTYFSALNGGVTSAEMLANPYNTYATLSSNDFLQIPILQNSITDQHFTARTRQGRLLGFMARIRQDEGREIKAIAVDEKTAVCIDTMGIGRVFCVGGATGNAYFAQFNCEATTSLPQVCAAGQPLSFGQTGSEKVIVAQIAGDVAGSNTFDLNDWHTATNAQWQAWAADQNQTFLNPIAALPSCFTAITEPDMAINSTQLSVYPNPTSGVFNIETDGLNTELKVYDALGRMILNQYLSTKTGTFSLDNEPNGVYLLVLKGQKGMIKQVLIKN